MMSNKTRSEVDLRALDKTLITTLSTMDPIPTIPIFSALAPHHSGRVVIQLKGFMYLGEFFKAIQDEHEIDPIDYDETMSDVTTHIWKEAMKAESESIYSN